jgi:lipopolysaccharide export system protein LptC
MGQAGNVLPEAVQAPDRVRATDYVPRAVAGLRGVRHYSRFVRTLKVLLPVAAAAIAVLVIAWPGYDQVPSRMAFTFATTTEEATGQTGMANARFLGTDNERRPFMVTAARAVPDDTDPDRITMTSLQADMTLDDGAWMSLMAETGRYDRVRQVLDLGGPISIFSDAGYEFHARSAIVDLRAGTAESDEPVEGHGPFGALTADRFRILEQGNRLVFEQRVRMTLRPTGTP